MKASSGPRYVVGVRVKLDKAKLTTGTRVTLDITTLTIMRILPREVDPVVFQMMSEGNFLFFRILFTFQIDPGNVSFNEIGGLNDQIRTLREVY